MLTGLITRSDICHRSIRAQKAFADFRKQPLAQEDIPWRCSGPTEAPGRRRYPHISRSRHNAEATIARLVMLFADVVRTSLTHLLTSFGRVLLICQRDLDGFGSSETECGEA